MSTTSTTTGYRTTARVGEPVARYGPFVMNSREELLRAVEDFQAGRMGVLD